MNKIPKIINYCWFGKNPLSELAEKCLKSWGEYCPDYKIVRWDESNVRVSENSYAQEAYDSKKWAFVADYARLKILYENGGVYLDTDVELINNLDKVLKNRTFFGFEDDERVSTAIIGTVQKNEYFKLLLYYYNQRHFINKDNTFDVTTNVTTITKSLRENYNLNLDNKLQKFNDGLVVYPKDWFSPKSFETGTINITKNTLAIHHFSASWWTEEERKTFYSNSK